MAALKNKYDNSKERISGNISAYGHNFFICWIMLHLGEFQSATVLKYNILKGKLDELSKLAKKLGEFQRLTFFIILSFFFLIFENKSVAGNVIQLNKKSLTG